ncbi:fumarylacetoacetate hydrolase family protein [Streptomyces sp. NBC_01092]|nr:fumarylacetoacetate hydrolase family protein [Streptomyces sp. NBC_01092]
MPRTRADSDGELGVVIGRPIPDVTTDEALGHVFGRLTSARTMTG